jgi:hypothetical protein
VSFLASYVALWVLVVFLALVAVGLLREVTIMKRSLSQAGLRGDAPLVIGSRAPRFSAVDARSGRVVTSKVLDGETTAILFLIRDARYAAALRTASRVSWRPIPSEWSWCARAIGMIARSCSSH